MDRLTVPHSWQVRNCKIAKVQNNERTKQRKYESTKQRKYETTTVKNNESAKVQNCETTKIRNNESTNIVSKGLKRKSFHPLTWLCSYRPTVLQPFRASFYRSCTAQSTFLLCPTMFSYHKLPPSLTTRPQPLVLRPCTVLCVPVPHVWRVRCAVSWCEGRFDVRAHRTFLVASSWSWRQPHPLVEDLPSADRINQTEGDAVSRAGSSRFDDVASFIPSCTSAWQDNSCKLHSAEQPTYTRGPLLQALQFVLSRLTSCEQVRSSSRGGRSARADARLCTSSGISLIVPFSFHLVR